MSLIYIKRAVQSDLPAIMTIIDHAKAMLKKMAVHNGKTVIRIQQHYAKIFRPSNVGY